MNKKPTIDEIRAQIESDPGEMGLILGTSEEAALDFFNRLDPNLIMLVFHAHREQEEHLDEMREALDALRATADEIKPTLPKSAPGTLGDEAHLKVFTGLFWDNGRYNPAWQDYAEQYKDNLPDQIIKQAQEYVDLYTRLHPVSVILRKEYEKDEERQAQAKASADFLQMLFEDEEKIDGYTRQMKHEDGSDAVTIISYTDYVNTIKPQDLKKCATACRKARRKSWADQFSALAKVWDKYDTPTRKKALKDELTIDTRLTFEASVYLYRCIMARMEKQPLAPVIDDIPQIATYPADTFWQPLDLLSNNLFNQPINKQASFLPEVRPGSDMPDMFSADFSALPENVRKRLTPFDKRVMCAYYSLTKIQKIDAPNDPYGAVSPGDLCRRIKIDPNSTTNKRRVKESMIKMNSLPIRYDRYDNFSQEWDTLYNDNLISAAITPGRNPDNGQIVKECFIPKVNERSVLTSSPVPFLKIQDEAGLMTAYDSKLLDTPWQSTDGHIAIEDYILRRVQQYKNHELKGEAWENSRTIVIDNMFNECNIDPKDRSKMREDIDKKLLPFYAKEGYFTIINREYKTTKDRSGKPLNREDFKGLLKFTFKTSEEQPRKIPTKKK